MKYLRNLFISLLAFIYLILESLFWDTLLAPIYQKCKTLTLYQLSLSWIAKQHKYTILGLFVFFFVLSEFMGIVALALLAQGMIFLFVFLYIVKFIPVAIAFSVLENSKELLLTISWFGFIYNGVMKVLDIIKSNSLFIQSKAFMETTKGKIESIMNLFKKEKHSKMKLFRRLFLYILKKRKS